MTYHSPIFDIILGPIVNTVDVLIVLITVHISVNSPTSSFKVKLAFLQRPLSLLTKCRPYSCLRGQMYQMTQAAPGKDPYLLHVDWFPSGTLSLDHDRVQTDRGGARNSSVGRTRLCYQPSHLTFRLELRASLFLIHHHHLYVSCIVIVYTNSDKIRVVI